MKNYLIYSFKRKLPLFIIIAVTFFMFALVSGTSVDFVRRINKEGYLIYTSLDGGFLGLTIALFSVMTFLPFFSMNYRYSLAKSDAFRQAPFKERKLRIGEHLVTLVTILITFTLSFIFLFLIIRIRNATVILPKEDEMFRYELIVFNYIYYLPLYFVTIILATGQYFISYLLISRSNNFLNSFLILVMGECLLGSICIIPIIFAIQNNYQFNVLSSASVIMPIVYLYNQFNPLIVNGGNNFVEFFTRSSYQSEAVFYTKVIGFIVSAVIYIGTAILGVVAFLLEKDPSSEWANKPGSNNLAQEIIYHVGFALFGGFISLTLVGSSILSNLMFYILYSASYYTLYGLLHRNFKMNLKQILTLVGVMLFIFTVSIVFMFTRTQ